MMAYGLNRTLLLDERRWRYSQRGWTAAFRPLSRTCQATNTTFASASSHSSQRSSSSRSRNFPVFEQTNTSSTTDSVVVDWRSRPDDDADLARLRRAHQINLPIIDALRPKPSFLPPAVPADLAPKIAAIHAQPFVWWIGQFMWFLWQLDDDMQRQLDDLATRQYEFGKSPIVGIHIRRTDKIGIEAAFHNTDEYMKAAGVYFDRLDNIRRRRHREKRECMHANCSSNSAPPLLIERRAFVATDDASVLDDIRRRYGRSSPNNWTILGDERTAQSAAVARRNSDASLVGIVRDIELLSRTDFLVCTFSSQVCRAAYELMQARQTKLYGRDASEQARSLDDIYYYGGQNQRDWLATMPHRARNAREIDLKINDVVGVAGNHWDGMSYGVNRRTRRKGLFPSFKVVEKVLAVAMPAKEYV